MPNQTAADRRKRLLQGLCPIHGLPMGQVDIHEGIPVVECCRKDCCIRGEQITVDCEVLLSDEFAHLIDPSAA